MSLLYNKLQNPTRCCPPGLNSFFENHRYYASSILHSRSRVPQPLRTLSSAAGFHSSLLNVPHSCLSGWSRTAVHHYQRTREAHRNGWWGDWHTDTEDYVHPCMHDDRNRLITALNCWCSGAARTVETATFFHCHTFTDRFSRFVSVCLTIFPSVWVFGTQNITHYCVFSLRF